MDDAAGIGSGAVSSLPPPCPRSPPEYPDLYGKRRESARVQMLEREIGFLEEELKSVQVLEPASRCCKEVVDFSLANSDPLIPTCRKRSRFRGGFWKWLWSGISCLNFSWVCCCCYAFCPPDLNLPCHCACESCIHCPKCRCPFPKCPPSSCCFSLRLPKWSRPSCCCRCSCCWFPRIPHTCCSCCPWNHCSCGNCRWDCSCGRIRRGCLAWPKCSCDCSCLAWPKCSCDCRCTRCWCPELPQNPCSCFSCRGLRCINPCYYCY